MHSKSHIADRAGLAMALGLSLAVNVHGASADDTWTGASDPPDNLFTTDGNWESGTSPGIFDSSLDFVLDAGDSICDYDWPVPGHNFIITITGTNPTFFTMNVNDDDFLPSTLTLEGFSKIDADVCVDVQGVTNLSGLIMIDVAPGVNCCLDGGFVDKLPATLLLTGEAHFLDLRIDSDTANDTVRLTLDDGGDLFVDRTMRIESEWETSQTAHIVGLVLYEGSITAETLLIHAGQTADRRVAIDLDDDMTVRIKTIMSAFAGQPPAASGGGIVNVDIDPDQVFELAELVLEAPCTLKVTGGTQPGFLPGKLQATTVGLPLADCECP